jgi:hypothetical protein
MQHLLRKRELILFPYGNRAESGWLGAHAVLRPESRQEHRSGEALHGLQVILQKNTLIREVIEDGVSRPFRKPGAVNNERHR